MKNIKKLSNITCFNIESLNYKCSTIKNSFYLKSLQLKQDFSKFKTHYRLAHPKYWDMERERTAYQINKRDYRKPEFRGVDPLFFEDCLTYRRTGVTLEQTLEDIRNIYPVTSENKSMYGQFKCILLMYHIVKNRLFKYMDVFFQLESIVNFKDEDMEMMNGRFIYAYLYCIFSVGHGNPDNLEIAFEYMEYHLCKMRAEWILDLLEIAHDNNYNSEDFRHYLMEYTVDRLSEAYEKEFKYRQSAIYRLVLLLLKGNYIGSEFDPYYDMLMKDCKERKTPLTEYQQIDLLKLFNNYYNNPKSSRFQNESVKEVLDKYKAIFNKSHNLTYLYDKNTYEKLDFNQLVLKRNSINDKNHYIELMIDEQETIIKEDEEIEKVQIVKKEDIVSFMEESYKNGVDFQSILFAIKLKFPDENEKELENTHEEFMKKIQKKSLENIVKEGKFDKLFEKKSVKKVKEMKPAASDKKDAGKGAPGGKGDAPQKGKGKK